ANCPILPGAVSSLKPSGRRSLSFVNIRTACCSARGTAPRLSASCWITLPSLPLRPAGPPSPAMGLTMSPKVNSLEVTELQLTDDAPSVHAQVRSEEHTSELQSR